MFLEPVILVFTSLLGSMPIILSCLMDYSGFEVSSTEFYQAVRALFKTFRCSEDFLLCLFFRLSLRKESHLN